MKYLILMTIASIVPLIFILLAASSAYHRRKQKRANPAAKGEPEPERKG